MNIFSLILIWLSISISFSHGQPCEAESMFNQFYAQAKDHLAEQKCVKISISEVYKPEDHNMVYRWNTGDGKQKEGLDVTHCYEEYGRYTATLDAILPETDFISENEMSLDLVIKEPVKVALTGDDKADIEQTTSFSFSVSPLITYEVDQVYWQVGDTAFYCGIENLTHQFSIPGKYVVKLLIRLENLDGYFYIADHRTIEVKGHNIFGHQLEAFFRAQEDFNPFLADKVHLAFVNQAGNNYYQYQLEADDSLYLLLPPAQSYEIYLWRGNRYTSPLSFSTAGCKDSLATFTIIRSAIQDVLSANPEFIPPVAFELNSTSLDRKVKKLLKGNVKKLKKFQGFTITVGSFTHTGGALHVNLDFSDARSELVKEYLENKLDKQVHLQIANAREETCLINTSLITENYREDESFNGKTYLKISGIEKAL